MENVTRDVIADLWPLYVSGEASADTRGLIEAFIQRIRSLPGGSAGTTGGRCPAAMCRRLHRTMNSRHWRKSSGGWPGQGGSCSSLWSSPGLRLAGSCPIPPSMYRRGGFIVAAGVRRLFLGCVFV